MALDKEALKQLKALRKEFKEEMNHTRVLLGKKNYKVATVNLFTSLEGVQQQLDIIIEALTE